MAKKASISRITLQKNRADFEPEFFENLVLQKGLRLFVEKMLPCPCKNKTSGQPNVACPNCNGTGILFKEPFKARGVIQSIGYNPKYQNYGKIDEGTAMLTMNYDDRIGWLDRITLRDGENIHAEMIYPKNRNIDSETKCAGLFIYEPTELHEINLYNENTKQIVDLIEGEDYEINGKRLILSQSYSDALQNIGDFYNVSVRYKHFPQYLVKSIEHNIRNTRTIRDGSRERMEELPLKCIIRKTHYELGDQGFNQ